MTRWLLIGGLLAGGVGCTGFRPVGPLAHALPDPSGTVHRPDTSSPPETVVVPAPKPTPPLNLVDPTDVTTDDPHAAAQKLLNEIENDRRTTLPPPRTAEVSRYKNGVKQE